MRPAIWSSVAALSLGLAATSLAEEKTQPTAKARTGTKTPAISTSKLATTAEIEKGIERGIKYLLESQNKDGSWGGMRRTKGLNIYAPVPGAHHAFTAAVTAMAITALIESDDGSRRVSDAIDRAEAWLLEYLPRVRRATPDAIYNNWTHGYSIQALVRLHHRHRGDEQRQELIEDRIKQQIAYLGRYESVDGGWGYYDFNVGSQRPTSSSTSFMTATILVALDEAKELEIEAPKPVVQRAIASIKRQQKPDFSYLYGEYMKWSPMYDINRPAGSLGRSQACNLALRLWGDQRITNEVLDTWLQRLFDRNLWLDMGRKRPVPHESWFAVAGYFYYYGHYYGALCIEQLPVDQRPTHQGRMARILLDKQEKDGSWWDFPFYDYHQPYGTAFALMTLVRCLPAER
ncbi:hypothetical protein Pan216_34800 [Planctomycetes bacterium Pan216]|uniref:Squalene cyclase C-terminal domain-containing protein n=1 Tax=Kolteria novifilia TaxID=2527975 RepID=A0A518B6L0_9BACT|nr:hypothetical protein Pan216_34800 [Planctomycetes bacterium Pan216]